MKLKSVYTILLTYVIFDLIFIIANHFEYYNQIKPPYLTAWFPFAKEAIELTYYGNDGSVLLFYPLIIMSVIFCYFIALGIIKSILNFKK